MSGWRRFWVMCEPERHERGLEAMMSLPHGAEAVPAKAARSSAAIGPPGWRYREDIAHPGHVVSGEAPTR